MAAAPLRDRDEVRGTLDGPLGGLALARRHDDLAVGGHLRSVVEDGRRADEESEVLLGLVGRDRADLDVAEPHHPLAPAGRSGRERHQRQTD
jgi:hypothetical protein